MNFTSAELVILLVGLAFIFFGLPIFKSALGAFGFIVGALYGLLLFSLFADKLTLSPTMDIVLWIAAGLVGGLVGVTVARFAQVLFVFLAGGLVGLMMKSMFAGAPLDQAAEQLSVHNIKLLFHPSLVDLIWFVVGGAIFVTSIDTVTIVAIVAFGTTLVYHALFPLHMTKPEWVIPVVIGVLGLMFQMGLRRRAIRGPRVVVVERPEHHR